MKCREKLYVFFFVYTVNCFQAVFPSLSITDIKDTYTILKNEFKQISPTHGMLCWDLIQRYYELGDRQEASVKLVYQLFHEVQGALNITMKPSLPPTHFSAKTIGKIVAGLELLRLNKIDDLKAYLIGNEDILKQLIAKKKTLKNPANAFNKLFLQAKGVVLQDVDFQESVKKVAGKYAKIWSDGEKNKKDIVERVGTIKQTEQAIQQKWGNLKTKIVNAINQKEKKSKLIKAYGEAVQKNLGKIISGKAKKKDYESSDIKKAFFSGDVVALPNIEEKRSKVLEELKKQEVLKTDLEALITLEKGRAAVQSALQQQKAEVGAIGSKLNKYDCFNLLSKLIEFVDNLQKSFEESGGTSKPEDQKYITHFPIYCLLVFLCQKVDTKEQLKDYFDAMQEMIGKDITVLLKKWTDDAYKMEDVEKGKKIIENLMKKKADQIDIVKDLDANYELLVYTVIKDRSNLPKPLKFTNVSFPKKVYTFSNCTETVLRLLCNIAVFDKSKATYSIDMLTSNKNIDDSKIDEEFKKYYKKYPSNDRSDAADYHQAWNDVVQNKPGVVYANVISKDGKLDINIPWSAYGFVYFGEGVVSLEDIKSAFKNADSVMLVEIKGQEFVKLVLHGVTYLVFDPSKFQGYEIRANLKNVIVVLNRLFGLGLFENKNMPNYGEEDFQSKYFEKLCEKLNWEIRSEVSNEHRSADQIELEVNNSKFYLKISVGHADYSFPQQEAFYENATEILFPGFNNRIKSVQDHFQRNILECFLQLFSPSITFVDWKYLYFIENYPLDYLKRYFYFLVNTTTDDDKIKFLNKIVSSIKKERPFGEFEETFVLNIIDALSKTADRIYQDTALRLLLKPRVNHAARPNIQKKIKQLWHLIQERGDVYQQLSALNRLHGAGLGGDFEKQSEKLAKTGIKSSNREEVRFAFYNLLHREKYDEAFDAAKERYRSNNVSELACEILSDLVKKDKRVVDIMGLISDDLKNKNRKVHAFYLLKALVVVGYGLREAVSAVVNNIEDADPGLFGLLPPLLKLVGVVIARKEVKAMLTEKECEDVKKVAQRRTLKASDDPEVFQDGWFFHTSEEKQRVIEVIQKLAKGLGVTGTAGVSNLEQALEALKNKLSQLSKQLQMTH